MQIIGSLNTESDAVRKYSELNEKIEQMTYLLYILVVKASLIMTFPSALLVTAINYFIYDLGAESYFLPVPLMYV